MNLRFQHFVSPLALADNSSPSLYLKSKAICVKRSLWIIEHNSKKIVMKSHSLQIFPCFLSVVIPTRN